MDQRDGRKQEDIQGMGLVDMGLLVEPDDRILFRILPAHDDGTAPAEGGDIGLGQYEPGAVLQTRGGAFPDGPIHPDHRDGGPAQHGEEAEDVEEFQVGDGGGGGRAGRQGGLGSRLGQRPDHEERHLHRPEPQHRQQEARYGAHQQQDAVQAEEGRPAHHQKEECVEQRQVQAAPADIKEERSHFRALSIRAIRSFSS